MKASNEKNKTKKKKKEKRTLFMIEPLPSPNW